MSHSNTWTANPGSAHLPRDFHNHFLFLSESKQTKKLTNAFTKSFKACDDVRKSAVKEEEKRKTAKKRKRPIETDDSDSSDRYVPKYLFTVGGEVVASQGYDRNTSSADNFIVISTEDGMGNPSPIIQKLHKVRDKRYEILYRYVNSLQELLQDINNNPPKRASAEKSADPSTFPHALSYRQTEHLQLSQPTQYPYVQNQPQFLPHVGTPHLMPPYAQQGYIRNQIRGHSQQEQTQHIGELGDVQLSPVELQVERPATASEMDPATMAIRDEVSTARISSTASTTFLSSSTGTSARGFTARGSGSTVGGTHAEVEIPTSRETETNQESSATGQKSTGMSAREKAATGTENNEELLTAGETEANQEVWRSSIAGQTSISTSSREASATTTSTSTRTAEEENEQEGNQEEREEEQEGDQEDQEGGGGEREAEDASAPVVEGTQSLLVKEEQLFKLILGGMKDDEEFKISLKHIVCDEASFEKIHKEAKNVLREVAKNSKGRLNRKQQQRSDDPVLEDFISIMLHGAAKIGPDLKKESRDFLASVDTCFHNWKNTEQLAKARKCIAIMAGTKGPIPTTQRNHQAKTRLAKEVDLLLEVLLKFRVVLKSRVSYSD